MRKIIVQCFLLNVHVASILRNHSSSIVELLDGFPVDNLSLCICTAIIIVLKVSSLNFTAS